MVKDEIDRYTVRFPADLMIEIRVMAARSRRSVNGQIVAMLENAVLEAQNEKSGTPA